MELVSSSRKHNSSLVTLASPLPFVFCLQKLVNKQHGRARDLYVTGGSKGQFGKKAWLKYADNAVVSISGLAISLCNRPILISGEII